LSESLFIWSISSVWFVWLIGLEIHPEEAARSANQTDEPGALRELEDDQATLSPLFHEECLRVFTRSRGDSQEDQACLSSAWHGCCYAVIGLLKLSRMAWTEGDAPHTCSLTKVGSSDDDSVSGFPFVGGDFVEYWRFTETGGRLSRTLFLCEFWGGCLWGRRACPHLSRLLRRFFFRDWFGCPSAGLADRCQADCQHSDCNRESETC
jgi:hypothetical protein